VTFPAERKKDILGIGGATLRSIEETFDVHIDLTEEGQASVFSEDSSQAQQVHMTSKLYIICVCRLFNMQAPTLAIACTINSSAIASNSTVKTVRKLL
jgi:polyribonucleotide nucleotidyltransferase